MKSLQPDDIEVRKFEVNSILEVLKEYDEYQLQAFADIARTLKKQKVDQPYETWCELSNIYRDIIEGNEYETF